MNSRLEREKSKKVLLILVAIVLFLIAVGWLENWPHGMPRDRKSDIKASLMKNGLHEGAGPIGVREQAQIGLGDQLEKYGVKSIEEIKKEFEKQFKQGLVEGQTQTVGQTVGKKKVEPKVEPKVETVEKQIGQNKGPNGGQKDVAKDSPKGSPNDFKEEKLHERISVQSPKKKVDHFLSALSGEADTEGQWEDLTKQNLTEDDPEKEVVRLVHKMDELSSPAGQGGQQ